MEDRPSSFLHPVAGGREWLGEGLRRLHQVDTIAFRVGRSDRPLGDCRFIGAGATRLSTRSTVLVWVLATQAEASDALARMKSVRADAIDEFRSLPVYNPVVWFFSGGVASCGPVLRGR